MFAVGGCGSADVEGAPVERKSFAFSGKTLTIDADNSEVELVPADVKAVEVERQVDGWVFLGDGPESSWKMEGETLTFRLECDAIASNCNARHSVKVPRGVAVTVKNDNGSVIASGFDTALSLRSDNGEVTVRDSSGALEMFSDNGEVTGERIAATKVTANSNNGTVRLGFSVAPAMVDTGSDNGEITIEVPKSTAYNVTTTTDNGETSVDVGHDPKSAYVIKAHSDNGDVVVRSAN
ncbi:hypothetical protein [Streptomyces sp. NPDC000410]|uniref:DUF4097 family beta strand repeat-containing protein n=1 Tax=Streptomyces sp. NPDC000410 TaxID=3154254 RepID=UPI003327C4EB